MDTNTLRRSLEPYKAQAQLVGAEFSKAVQARKLDSKSKTAIKNTIMGA